MDDKIKIDITPEDEEFLKELTKVKMSIYALENYKRLIDFIGLSYEKLCALLIDYKNEYKYRYVCKGTIELELASYTKDFTYIKEEETSRSSNILNTISLLGQSSRLNDCLIEHEKLKRIVSYYEYLFSNNGANTKFIYISLRKELDKTKLELEKTNKNLTNEKYEKERTRGYLDDYQEQLKKLKAQLAVAESQIHERSLKKMSEELGNAMSENIRLKLENERLLEKIKEMETKPETINFSKGTENEGGRFSLIEVDTTK